MVAAAKKFKFKDFSTKSQRYEDPVGDQRMREKEIEDRGGSIPGDPEEARAINEGLSRGSLYRRRYRRY